MNAISKETLDSFALSGPEVLDAAYARHNYDWTAFKAIYNGDEQEDWSVVGTRYVDLDRGGSYYANVTLFRDLDQVAAHAAVAYLEKKRTRQ